MRRRARLGGCFLTCSAPPRSTMVAVLACVQPVKMLKRSLPTCRSSKCWQKPSTSGTRLFTVVCTCAPVALATRCRSSSATRPAQKMSRSAKYCTEPQRCQPFCLKLSLLPAPVSSVPVLCDNTISFQSRRLSLLSLFVNKILTSAGQEPWSSNKSPAHM